MTSPPHDAPDLTLRPMRPADVPGAERLSAEGFHEQLRGVPGAETEQDVVRRIVPAVEEHLEALEPGTTGIAVTHGAALCP